MLWLQPHHQVVAGVTGLQAVCGLWLVHATDRHGKSVVSLLVSAPVPCDETVVVATVELQFIVEGKQSMSSIYDDRLAQNRRRRQQRGTYKYGSSSFQAVLSRFLHELGL